MKNIFDYKNILFDADDTLWYDSIYFRNLESKYIEVCEKYNISKNVAKEFLDSYLFYKSFRGEKGYSDSIMNVAIHNHFSDSDINILRVQINIFLNHPIELTEGIIEILNNLPQNKFIITKGNYLEQINKILKSGLSPFFSNAIVVSKKNAEIYRSILNILDLETEETVMVGNSLLHDIIPAAEAGLKTIWYNHNLNSHGRNMEKPNDLIEINHWEELLNKI